MRIPSPRARPRPLAARRRARRPARATRIAAVVIGASLALAPGAHAQAHPEPAAAPRRAWPGNAGAGAARTDADSVALRRTAVYLAAATGSARTARADAPWWAPVASAVVPGSGQAALGQDRWLAYAAVEGLAWIRYGTDLREARRERREYRSLADKVARALFGGTRPVGSFEYYEHMERYVESGVYDAVPGGALDPDSDTATFNGATWLLARETFWSDPEVAPPADSPEYGRAIAFYMQRAVGPEYRWSWRNAQLEQDLFRRAIARSNAAFRRSAQDLAVVLANHVLSTVDSYVTVRIRRGTTRREGIELEAALPWPRAGHPVFAPTAPDRQ